MFSKKKFEKFPLVGKNAQKWEFLFLKVAVDVRQDLHPKLDGPVDVRQDLHPKLDGPVDARQNLHPKLDGPVDARQNLHPKLDGPVDARQQPHPKLDGPVDARQRPFPVFPVRKFPRARTYINREELLRIEGVGAENCCPISFLFGKIIVTLPLPKKGLRFTWSASRERRAASMVLAT